MSGAEQLLEAMPEGIEATLSAAEAACLIAARIAQLPREVIPPVVGLNGAQGSGKSTIAKLVAEALERFHDLRPALLSLDDFYLGLPPRYLMEREVHPLCVTRGVPGTHDVPTMVQTFDALDCAGARTRTPLPTFDKVSDDRLAREVWPMFEGRPEVVLLEGWCVGLQAEDVPDWTGPINALEAEMDPRGEWFQWSLAALRDDYRAIWRRIELLISIEMPQDFEMVIESRLRQEQGLPENAEYPKMDREKISRFVQHYERFTRALWAAMPERADMLFRRDRDFGYSLVKG
jgi:D-glycerate 3-kinase